MSILILQDQVNGCPNKQLLKMPINSINEGRKYLLYELQFLLVRKSTKNWNSWGFP